MIQNFAYIAIKRADGTYLEKMNLKANEVDTNLDFPVLLDRKTSLTGVYDAGTNLTTWTTPYPESATRSVVLNGSWGTNFRGRNLEVTQASNTTLTAQGDYSANPAFVGRNYNFKYEFSKFFVRELKTATSKSTVNTGRLQIKKVNLVYGDSGFFEIDVTPLARSTGTYKFTGQILGSAGFVLGVPNMQSGTFKLPVQCKNEDVTITLRSDSFLPCNFLSAEWTGIYSILSQRLT